MVTKFKQGKKESEKAFFNRLYRKGYKTVGGMRKVAGKRYSKITAFFAKAHPTKKRVAGAYWGDVAKAWETGIYDTKAEAKEAVHKSHKWKVKRADRGVKGYTTGRKYKSEAERKRAMRKLNKEKRKLEKKGMDTTDVEDAIEAEAGEYLYGDSG